VDKNKRSIQMKKITIDDITYEIIEDNRNGYVEEEFKNRYTDYFYDFDYVVGDWAYDKLRLKGFYSDDNKKAKDFNKISNLDKYLKEKCAYGCKYFVAKKINI
jgi:uncharacterized protein YutD